MVDCKNVLPFMITVFMTSQAFPCCSSDYQRLFMLERLQNFILPRIEELKARTAVHLSENIMETIDALNPVIDITIQTESNCAHCDETTHCFEQDCSHIDRLMIYLNTHVSSEHRELVKDITRRINLSLNPAMECEYYNGPTIETGNDVSVDIQYQTAKDTYKFLTFLQERYS